jgi:uncharacterized membrane protein YhaH (DUF805 family)
MLELFFILIILALIGLPIIVIATENSGKCANRQTYILVFLIYVLSMIVVRYSLAAGAPREIIYLEMPIILALLVWLFRATVQRVRDMGRSKALAYVAVIPLVGTLFQIYLTFPASAPKPNTH